MTIRKIVINTCKHCGGKGRLFDFDHYYSPNSKTIKFLQSEQELTSRVECNKCGRITDSFKIPMDAIQKWNNGEMYTHKERCEKHAQDYVGEIYTDEEIKDFILKTNFKDKEYRKAIGLELTNNDCLEIHYNDEEGYSTAPWIYVEGESYTDVSGHDIDDFIEQFLSYLKKLSLKVKEMKINELFLWPWQTTEDQDEDE